MELTKWTADDFVVGSSEGMVVSWEKLDAIVRVALVEKAALAKEVVDDRPEWLRTVEDLTASLDHEMPHYVDHSSDMDKLTALTVIKFMQGSVTDYREKYNVDSNADARNAYNVLQEKWTVIRKEF